MCEFLTIVSGWFDWATTADNRGYCILSTEQQLKVITLLYKFAQFNVKLYFSFPPEICACSINNKKVHLLPKWPYVYLIYVINNDR